MRKVLLLLMVLHVAIISHAQEDIFKKHGYNKEPLTLSKGKYKETFYNEDVMQVGTVLIDTRTEKVVQFLEIDTAQYAYRAEITSRFLTIDPLAEEYFNWSPYVYVKNNPINAIDPDGRKVVFTLPLQGGGTMYLTYNTSGQLVNSKGQALKVTQGSHLDRVVTAYNKMLNSDDTGLSGQIRTLINSDKEHFVSGVQGSDNSVIGGNKNATLTEDKSNIKKGIGVGSKTQYNFSAESKADFKKSTGVENSDFTTVVHEVRHAYDYDQGKMADSNGKGAKDPAEQRAVKNENKARKIEKLPMRTKYRGEEIDPNKLK